MKENRKLVTRGTCFFLAIFCVLVLYGCGSGFIKGTEKTYNGIVTDRGMSVVNEGDHEGRAYIIISTGEEEICFWLKDNYSYDARVGDTVTIQSAIEEGTNLLIAVKVTTEDAFSVKIVNDSSADIYGIGYTYYVNGEIVGSGGVCNADNSLLEKGENFVLEDILDEEEFDLELSVKDKKGNEYPCASKVTINEKTKQYEISIIGDFEKGFKIGRD